MAIATRPLPLQRRVDIPVVGLAAVTAWLAWRGGVALIRSGWMWRSIGGAWTELAGPAVLAFLAATIVCERLWPAERRPFLARGHLHDAAFFVLSTVVVVPLVTVLGVASASVLPTWLRLPRLGLPVWAVTAAALVLMDAANWLVHLAEHRVRVLWRVHAVHHSQEELSVLTTFRAHPLVHTVSFFAATVPVVAVMGDRSIAPALITAYLCLGALPHANVGWTYGPVGKLVVSPAYHRIHHNAAGPYDVNMAIVVPWWDVLAGRAVFPRRGDAPCATGLAGRPLAVEHAPERPPTPRLMAGQLLEPFVTHSKGGAQ